MFTYNIRILEGKKTIKQPTNKQTTNPSQKKQQTNESIFDCLKPIFLKNTFCISSKQKKNKTNKKQKKREKREKKGKK